MTAKSVDVSIVFPVYNEVETLRELHERIVSTMEATGKSFEMIAVDDGSDDGSFELLKELRGDDERLRVVKMARNFGQSPSLYAGFAIVTGEQVVMIDADLQNPPEEIPKLLDKLDEGYDAVNGWRQGRQDGFLRQICSRALNLYIAKVTRVPLHDCGCGLKAFRREVVQNLSLFQHRSRYLPVDVSWLGARIGEVRVAHSARAKGKSKYGLLRLLQTGFDLLTSITVAPIQLVGLMGLLFAFGGFAMALRVLYVRLAFGNALQLESVIAIFFVLAGVQMVVTGLLCEYVVRILIEVQGKPYYVVKETLE